MKSRLLSIKNSFSRGYFKIYLSNLKKYNTTITTTTTKKDLFPKLLDYSFQLVSEQNNFFLLFMSKNAININ